MGNKLNNISTSNLIVNILILLFLTDDIKPLLEPQNNTKRITMLIIIIETTKNKNEIRFSVLILFINFTNSRLELYLYSKLRIQLK